MPASAATESFGRGVSAGRNRLIVEPESVDRLFGEVIDMNDGLTAEERDVLVRFEQAELKSAAGVEREVKAARVAARRTSNKIKRGNPRRRTQ